MALALIAVGSLVVPAMAAEVPGNEYDLYNYFTDQIVSESGEMVTDVYDMYRSWTDHDLSWSSGFNGSSSYATGSGYVAGNLYSQRVCFADGSSYFYDGFVKFYSSGHNLYYLGNIPAYGSFVLHSSFHGLAYSSGSGTGGAASAGTVYLYIECYDSNKNLIVDAPFGSSSFTHKQTVKFDTILVLPSGTSYICPYFYVDVNRGDKIGGIQIGANTKAFALHHSYAIDDDNPPLETLPPESGSDGSMDEIKDVINNQGKVEQEAADSQGNASLDELTGAVPDESQGFMDAIKSLVGAMSYNGIDAQLTIPAVTIPGIPGVMSGYTLMGSNKIDFGFWVQKMPSKIITLVQALLTLALIGYCFKELYSLISYLFTLKGAGSD